jgi:hypothetical protein
MTKLLPYYEPKPENRRLSQNQLDSINDEAVVIMNKNSTTGKPYFTIFDKLNHHVYIARHDEDITTCNLLQSFALESKNLPLPHGAPKNVECYMHDIETVRVSDSCRYGGKAELCNISFDFKWNDTQAYHQLRTVYYARVSEVDFEADWILTAFLIPLPP